MNSQLKASKVLLTISVFIFLIALFMIVSDTNPSNAGANMLVAVLFVIPAGLVIGTIGAVLRVIANRAIQRGEMAPSAVAVPRRRQQISIMLLVLWISSIISVFLLSMLLDAIAYRENSDLWRVVWMIRIIPGSYALLGWLPALLVYITSTKSRPAA